MDKLYEIMKCSKCGKEIADDSNFCEYCGTQMPKKVNSKQVDIRWCLLPTMIIATIAMGFAAESWDIRLFRETGHTVEPFFVVPLCIFIVSCWYGIKRLIPLSCIIMIVILFGISCKILYDSVNFRSAYQYVVKVSYSKDNDDKFSPGDYGLVYLRSEYNYEIKNEDEAKRVLFECALAIEEKLKREGKEIYGNIKYKDWDYYTGWQGFVAFFYISIFLIIYLIYAILAHKRGWKF